MAFRSNLKIRFGDIDRAGIVYFPRFLDFFHVALEEFFTSELKVDYHTIIDQHKIGFPVVHLETDFSSPFNYGDDIEVEVTVHHIGRTSVTFGYRAFKKEDETARITCRHTTVCIDMNTYKKILIPNWLSERLTRCRDQTIAQPGPDE